MNALEIAELLDHSALGSLGDFYYVADASKELKRLFVVEAQLVSYKADHASTLAALLTLMDKASEMEAELAAIRAINPAAWQSNFVGENDWHTCSKEHAEWVNRAPQEFIGYQTRALYIKPI